MFSNIYDEIMRIKQELLYLNTFLSRADRWAFLCSIFMMMGVFLPWVSAVGFFTQIGLMGGGDAHLILAITTLLNVKKAATSHIQAIEREQLSLLPLVLRRVSLSYILIGLTSVIISIVILLYFGSQYATIRSTVDIRWGFYLTMTSGLIIFLCGLERFRSS
jgi:hypothetical protein